MAAMMSISTYASPALSAVRPMRTNGSPASLSASDAGVVPPHLHQDDTIEQPVCRRTVQSAALAVGLGQQDERITRLAHRIGRGRDEPHLIPGDLRRVQGINKPDRTRAPRRETLRNGIGMVAEIGDRLFDTQPRSRRHRPLPTERVGNCALGDARAGCNVGDGCPCHRTSGTLVKRSAVGERGRKSVCANRFESITNRI